MEATANEMSDFIRPNITFSNGHFSTININTCSIFFLVFSFNIGPFIESFFKQEIL